MPLLPSALEEAAEDQRTTSTETPSDALRILSAGGDVDTYLSVAAWYRGLGDFASSNHVLDAAAARFADSPMVYAYLASNAWKEGRDSQAAQYAAQLAAAPYTSLFPHRVADALALSEVLAHNPHDQHALLLLGDFLFARGRYDDAAAKWRGAAARGLQSAELQRDLGIWAWRVKGDRELAASYFEKAIQMAPQQYRLYPQLDEIYAELGDSARRAKLYAAAPAAVLERDVVRVRQASFLTEQRQFDEALAVLNSHPFKPWEGGQIAREVYVMANLQQGRQEMSEKEYAKAEQSFRRALEYPANLAVGKPSHPHDEEAQYWLGEALNAQGKTDAARAAWQSAADSGADGDGNSALFRAVAERRLGDSQSAQEQLTRLAKLANAAQASAQDFCIAGRAQHFLGEDPLAQHDFRQALTLDPGNLCARMELKAAAQSAVTAGMNH